MQPRVLIIDDNVVFLDGLKKLFLEDRSNLLVRYATSLYSLKELLTRFLPDKIVVDIKLIERASKEDSALLFGQPSKLILLTTFENESYPHLQKRYGDIPIFCKTNSIIQLKNTLKF